MDAERVLDTLLAASATTAVKPQHGALQLNFVEEILGVYRSETGPSAALDDLFEGDFDGVGDTFSQLARRTKTALGRRSGPSHRALLATTGLLLQSCRRRGILRGLAGLGGHAVISGIALRGYRRYCLQGSSNPGVEYGAIVEALNPATATEADSLRYVRAMIAAISNGQCVSEKDLPWVMEGFRQCGIGSDEIDWIVHEFAEPAKIEELRGQAQTTAQATQIYAAVRLAIDPVSDGTALFVDQLAAELTLIPLLRAELDESTNDLKSE